MQTRVFAVTHKGEYYLHAVPAEAKAEETAAQLATKRAALVTTVAAIKDKLIEVGTHASVVAQYVGSLEKTESSRHLQPKALGATWLKARSLCNPNNIKAHM